MSTVLLVDDEADITEVLSDILTEEGHHVLTAVHGIQALEALAGASVDLVLTDLMMPLMDGRELLRALKADARLCHLPVVLTSAGNGARVVAEEIGVPLLPKPFELKAFLALMAQLLSGDRGGNSGAR